MDCAALAFTRQFYLALAIGRTVKDAFEIGRQAVAVSPAVPNSDEEMKKFVLLPADGDHDQPVFAADPVTQWPSNGATDAVSLFVGKGDGHSNIPEQPLPSPPPGFLGRETELYLILNDILSKRFVSLIGVAGVGLSSLASAVCHYINDRKSTMIQIEVIFFVRPQEARGLNKIGSLITPLYKQLVSAGLREPMRRGTDFDDIVKNILTALAKVKALLVFDGVDILDGSGEAQEFPLFLSALFRETKYVKVLITAHRSWGARAFAGVGAHSFHVGPLNLKNTVKLFLLLCPHVHTSQERNATLRKIVPETDGPLLLSDERMSESSKNILRQLGEGIPSRTFDIAYSMTKEEFDRLHEFAQHSR